MIVEKEHAIQELREKLINDIGDVERLTAEKAKMQIELQDAQEQVCFVLYFNYIWIL